MNHQKKKAFVRKAHVEEATTSIDFVSGSFEINFPILNWIRIKQEGLCSEGTCGGSNDLYQFCIYIGSMGEYFQVLKLAIDLYEHCYWEVLWIPLYEYFKED